MGGCTICRCAVFCTCVLWGEGRCLHCEIGCACGPMPWRAPRSLACCTIGDGEFVPCDLHAAPPAIRRDPADMWARMVIQGEGDR